jgi:CHASE2 domain-containing sensor protein
VREGLESDRASSARKPLVGRLDWMLAAGAAAFAVFVLIDVPNGPEHWSSDLATAWLSKHPKAQDEHIALVYISEATLRDAWYVSPIDRRVLGQLIEKIDNAEPALIGLDVILDRKTEPAKDDELINSIQNAKSKITLGMVEDRLFPSDVQDDIFSKRIVDLCKQASDSRINCGHVYLTVSRNQLIDTLINVHDVIRLTPESKQTMSFGEAVARASGPYTLSKSDYISWLLLPGDGSENFFTIDAADLWHDGADVLLKSLKGKIVLIGGNFKDKDQHFTPLSVRSKHKDTGLFIHAQYLSQLREGRTLNELPVISTGLIILFLFTGGCYVGRRALKSELWLQLAGVLLLVVASILFFIWNLIFPFAYAVVSWLVGVAVGHYGIPVHKEE